MSTEVEEVRASGQQCGAILVVLSELIGLLIDKGVLNQGDVIARYQRLSIEMMKRPDAQLAVQLADAIRDFAADEKEREPS